MHLTLEKILSIVRAQRRLVVAIFLGTVLIVTTLSLIWPKSYKATASVVIDAKADPVAAAAGGYSEQALASYVTTQADVIASERVAQRVVKAVGLDQDPKMRKAWLKSTDGQGDISIWLADYLIDRKLTVTAGQDAQGRQSNVIDITVKWSDADMAAKLANGFAQSTIETDVMLKVDAAKQYAQWFEQRIRALRADLEAKQKRLSDFQASAGIVATDDKLDVENTRLQELSSQLVAIQTQRQESSSHQKQAIGDVASLPEVLQSSVIGSLKKDLADAESKQQDIAARLGKNHPDYKAIDAQIDGLHKRIQQETAKIVASLGSASQVDARRESEIRDAVERQKQRVLELKHQHDESAVLDADVQAAQRDLDAVSLRLAQSNLESQTPKTNVVQLSVAAPPIKPAVPKIALNILLSIIVGGFLGIVTALLLELRTPRVRDGDELAQLCGVPTLALIDWLPPEPQVAAIAAPRTAVI